MARFRALLIGIAEYDDLHINDLSFVADGVSAVGLALESRGYVIEEGSGAPGWISGTDLRKRVWRFIDDAQHGDTLLIFLSGHGAHTKGVDYIVPSDVDLNYPNLAEICVPVTAWSSDLENTRAASVVFLIDACREGFDEQVQGGLSRVQWSKSKGLEVANRKIAFVFACPPGEVSRFGTGADDNGVKEEFSLFSRAIQQIAGDPDGPSTLSEFHESLADAMREIADAARKPRQSVRVRTESDHDTFVVLPRGTQSAERDSWRQLATSHPAWDCVPSADGASELRALAGGLAAHMAGAYRQAARACADDPWRDPELGARISERTGFLLSKVLANPELSPADAALLATVPFIYVSYWAADSARLRAVSPGQLDPRPGADGDRAAFERFARGYPRLLRRARAAPTRAVPAQGTPEGASAAAEIGWWIFHRWLTRRPESYTASSLDTLLRPAIDDSSLAAEVWDPARLIELLRCLGADPGFLSRTDRKSGLRPGRPVASGTKDDQTVRERLIAYILAVAHRLAIEPGLLPSAVSEHLGISDPVSLPGLLRTVATARWEPRGQSRALSAACEHPAIEVALREHVRDLDGLLSDAHRLVDTEADLAPLAKLPGKATAEAVGPKETAEGPAYSDAGVRFRLDEDRVQQLLMGEHLYGDRSLAIRELYQNALDACRYRQARTEYLRRTEGEPPGWTGLISFRQGTGTDGRPYIDCTDTGIGMGIRELSEVFAQAGARFADLPEFLEEQAEWARLSPPVKLFPNSRFGIGVLSYFMLADEITISTCRFGQDGRPGRRLLVSIAGPGTLFRVVDLGAAETAGTTVRLHLRADQEPVSCAEALGEVLWAAEFPTRVIDETGETYWDPGELAFHPASDHRGRAPSEWPTIIASGDAPVWWTSEGGKILADGIATDMDIAGVVVSLSGPHSPPLSVDRRRIIGLRPLGVEALLEQAVPDLLREPDGILTWDWLCRLAEDAPGVADLIAQAVIDTDRTWRIGDAAYSGRRIGCFPPDNTLLPSGYGNIDYGVLPDEVAAWRASALGCGAVDGTDLRVVPALPSDLILLSHRVGAGSSWLDPAAPVQVGHLVAAALKLRRPVHVVAARLSELGYQVPDASTLPGEVSWEDLVLAEGNLGADSLFNDVDRNWLAEPPRWYNDSSSSKPLLNSRSDDEHHYLSQDEPVPLGHIIGAAVGLRRTAVEVAERLTSLGYRVPNTSALPGDLDVEDLYLVHDYPWDAASWTEFDRHTYLDPAEKAPLGHLVRAALQWGRSVRDVADRLQSLGFTVPDPSGLPDDLGWDDVELMGSVADRQPTWLDTTTRVPVPHVLRQAAQHEVTASTVSARLAELGFEVPDLPHITPGPLTAADVALIDHVYAEGETSCKSRAPVQEAELLRIAAKVSRDPSLVRERLAALGCDVPSTVEAADPSKDAALISLGRTESRLDNLLGRTSPDGHTWLDPAKPASLLDVLRGAIRLGWPLRQAADRLRALGYETPNPPEGPADLSPADLDLAYDTRVGRGNGQDVPLSGLIYAAVTRGRHARELADRLALLGFTVPATSQLPDLLTPEDVALTKGYELTATGEYVQSPGAQPPLPVGDLLRLAAEIDRDVAYVTSRLGELGYQRPDPSGLERADMELIRHVGMRPRRRLSGRPSTYDHLDLAPAPTPVARVVQAALELGRPATEIADRLRYLGYNVPDLGPLLPRRRPGEKSAPT